MLAGDDLITNYAYNPDSLLVTTSVRDYDPITSAGGWRDTDYTYTANQLLETITDPESNVTAYDYDTLGRTAMVTDPECRKTRTFYSADGKVCKQLRAYQFGATSANEACTYGSTEQQCYARYTYAPSGQDAADYNGQVYSIQDANGNTTTYSYDSHDRLYDTTFPDSSYERNVSWDGAGNVTTFRNRAGEQVVATFDALNRQLTKSHSSFPNVTYGYDLLSRQTSVTQTGGQPIGFVFDKAGRLESTTAGSRTVSYLYDGVGNRERITWPDSFYVQYSYDDANRMDQVRENGSQVLADYDYDTASRRRRLTRSNGDVTTYSYEADSDLAGIAHTGLPSSPTFSFIRNDAHQITSQTISDPTLEWSPSANATTGYTPNVLNQYSSVGGVSYSYDTKGNLTSDGTRTYTFDAENRLLTALVSGTTTTYGYDGLGRRIKKSVGSTVTEFLLDGDEEIAEYNGSGTLLRRFVYGPAIDDRIVMYEGTGTAASNERFYYQNHQGSTMRTANGSGTVTETFVYGPYGESSTTTGNPYRYTGRRYDPETGLYFYRARYYSPTLGRFLQTDPIGYEDQMNLYAYVGNDPANMVDPTGNTTTAAGAAVGCALTGPACPGGAVVGAVIGTVIGIGIVIAINENANDDGDEETTLSDGETPEGMEDIYVVGGENTVSGNRYVGRTRDRKTRSRSTQGGRDRSRAPIVDTVPAAAAKDAEQQEMNDQGGVDNLDNRRNEVREDRWEDRGIRPPKPINPDDELG